MWSAVDRFIISTDLMGAMLLFVLVLCRFSGLFLVAPLFGADNVPLKIKALMLFLITLVTCPFVAAPDAEVVRLCGNGRMYGIAGLVAVCGGEVVIGLVFGLGVNLFFAAIQFAGQVLGQQIGFAMANMLDPVSNAQVSVFGQLYYMIAVGVFLAGNLHIELLGIIKRSFELVPLGCSLAWPHVCRLLAEGMGTTMWHFALRVALPGMLGIFLITVGLGFLARSVPEINIFMVGFGLKALVGIWLLYITIPFVVDIMREGVSFFMRDAAGLLTWAQKT